MGKVVGCALCHTSAPALNLYGADVAFALFDQGYDGTVESFLLELPAALTAVEPLDSDGVDELANLSNLEEIQLGTFPGDPQSAFSFAQSQEGFDPVFAYKRAKVAFCGEPPDHAELLDVPTEPTAGRAAVAAVTAACLSSDYWRNEALHRIADGRVRPQAAVGYDVGNSFSLGDYRYDYRLFSHALTDDRDARDLLVADYHVEEDGQLRTDTFNALAVGGNNGQPLARDRRAGMITTTWFLAIHTMFSEMPRTTAAQAYRAYLGQDIALSEGILPVANEPRDVDFKGVQEEECMRCHSTLDPLTYAFAYYRGINGFQTGTFSRTLGESVRAGNGGGTTAVLFDVDLDADPSTDPAEVGVVGFAQQAANTTAFARTVVFFLAQHALGRLPSPEDTLELLPLVDRFRTVHDHQAALVIADIVQTDAFGRP